MASNYTEQKYKEYINAIKRNQIITIYYEDLEEIERRLRNEGLRYTIKCHRDVVTIYRRK